MAGGTGPDDRSLDDAEVRAAIGALTDAELLRLRKVDARYRAGTDYEPGALLKSALCQAFLRERKCPRHVAFVRFIAGSIRSAASHRRKELRRQVPFDTPFPVVSGGRVDSRSLAERLPSPTLDPEALLMERENTDAVDAIMTLFDGDDEAQLVILALTEGLKGAALCAEVDLPSNRVHYVIRRIRRAVEKRWSEGLGL
ncbi:hypothetical protein MKK68_18775 [Methylobacterium sp. E-016]|uniref:hypothetical protein n=1 Tax=Methylobacterium sp. E-016 TaxID=2836556 RepID=UPI001FB9C2CF|nr:hypothetical protein [Methylobacterium sp. E-016]MCJ2077668.1 hypothetical protein [Methylobacterium sp. E-016]